MEICMKCYYIENPLTKTGNIISTRYVLALDRRFSSSIMLSNIVVI